MSERKKFTNQLIIICACLLIVVISLIYRNRTINSSGSTDLDEIPDTFKENFTPELIEAIKNS